MPEPLFTIGHSNHTPERFLELLRLHGITAVSDVRSRPYSRFNPHFNQDLLKQWLAEAQVYYVFQGGELGARSSDQLCYRDGKVVYDRLASQPEFQGALDRLVAGSARYRVALLCAEKEPLDCHRCILVAKQLLRRNVSVSHILADGSAEAHDQTLERLLVELRLAEPHMFRTQEETLELAYKLQEEKIAYAPPEPADPALVA